MTWRKASLIVVGMIAVLMNQRIDPYVMLWSIVAALCVAVIVLLYGIHFRGWT